MIISNALLRVFKFRFHDFEGTAFTLDHNNRQYLITARHIVEGFAINEPLQIFQREVWKSVYASLTGFADNSDIAVFSVEQQLTEKSLEITFSMGGILYGQEVFFLGFPYGMYGDYRPEGIGFPLPFIKRAIVSTMALTRDNCFYLDGINNIGFSGGPVVFQNKNDNAWHIAGVISGYVPSLEPITSPAGETDLVYEANSGIIQAFPIFHAIQIIEKNENGLLMSR